MALEAQGSSPCIHPAETVKPWLGGFKYFELVFASRTGSGLSPSGKAQDFDSCISLVRIQLAQSKSPDRCGRVPCPSGLFRSVRLRLGMHAVQGLGMPLYKLL